MFPSEAGAQIIISRDDGCCAIHVQNTPRGHDCGNSPKWAKISLPLNLGLSPGIFRTIEARDLNHHSRRKLSDSRFGANVVTVRFVQLLLDYYTQ
ncbi:unnamed protein product [Leptosia nina]|uniref:Uncharacterized protein n=1 Tax=Leptosia nina TaxID=320188 RepID=A0AAV1IXY9_9NEOP